MVTRQVANKGNGDCISAPNAFAGAAMPIDIVLVPPPGNGIPLPFPNTAKLEDAESVIATVRINGKPVVVKPSFIPTSFGAPSNGIKGINSPAPVNNECEFTSASSTVRAGGKFVIRHRDLTTQNAGNCTGTVKLKDSFAFGSGIILDPHLTNAEKQQITDAMDELYKRPRSRELIQQMQDPAINRGYTTTITIAPGNLATTYANPSGRFWNTLPPGTIGPPSPGVGTSATIQLDPSIIANIGEPFEIVLAHELVHAYHANQGIMLNGTRQLPGHTQPTNIRELQAIGLEEFANARLTESAFREERGLNIRTSHDGQNNFDYSPDPAKIPAQEFAKGDGGDHLVYAN